jgi:hypothetical protein
VLGLSEGSVQAQQRVALGDTTLHGGGRDTRTLRSEPTVTVEPLDHLPRLRPVLRGALYRSGTPSEAALSHLCERGWKRVYSLYGEHTTQTGPRNVNMLRYGRDVRSCQTEGSARSDRVALGTLGPAADAAQYLPRCAREHSQSRQRAGAGSLLERTALRRDGIGVGAASVLWVFCEQAEAYWRANANRGASYPLIMANIHNFKPIAWSVTDSAEQRALCPMSRRATCYRPTTSWRRR